MHSNLCLYVNYTQLCIACSAKDNGIQGLTISLPRGISGHDIFKALCLLLLDYWHHLSSFLCSHSITTRCHPFLATDLVLVSPTTFRNSVVGLSAIHSIVTLNLKCLGLSLPHLFKHLKLFYSILFNKKKNNNK